ncbi:MAG: hypothetical protein ACRD3Q_08310, partial [Terriglobales bacterium]
MDDEQSPTQLRASFRYRLMFAIVTLAVAIDTSIRRDYVFGVVFGLAFVYFLFLAWVKWRALRTRDSYT